MNTNVNVCIVLARLPQTDASLLRNVAKARGEGISTFVRRSIKSELLRLGYLSPEEAKALGLSGSSIAKTIEPITTSEEAC